MIATNIAINNLMIRAITPADWSAILDVQQQCYPDVINESQDVLQRKQQLASDSCFIMHTSAPVQGYCFAHPWQLGQPPKLNQLIPLPITANTLYVHDVAVAKHAQGLGLAAEALYHLRDLALKQQLGSLSLVAVNGAASYWQRFGFVSQPLADALSSYGDNAEYMVLPLSNG